MVSRVAISGKKNVTVLSSYIICIPSVDSLALLARVLSYVGVVIAINIDACSNGRDARLEVGSEAVLLAPHAMFL